MKAHRSLLLVLALAGLFAGIASARDWNILNQLRIGGAGTAVDMVRTNLKSYCESWRINVELHNVRDFVVVPQECIGCVQKYMTSSQYEDDLARAVDQVLLYLGNSCCNKKCDGNDGWIFDIDDTLLSTVPYYRTNSFGGEVLNTTRFEEWAGKSKAPAIEPIRELYHKIRERGIKIFLVSSRKEYLRSATVENLIQQGYYGWSNLILRGFEDEYKEVKEYKAGVRRQFENAGYRIWGVMSDQWSSFSGCPPPRRTFKLPNCIYYVA